MFLAKASKLGDYQMRSPMFKLDNWLVAGAAPVGAPVAHPSTSVIPGVSNTTAAAVGIGGLAAAAALAWYLMRK